MCGSPFSALPRPLARLLHRQWIGLIDLVYPSACPLCDHPLGPGPPRLCGNCRPEIELPGVLPRTYGEGLLAGAFLYRGAGGALVRSLKFAGDPGASLVLGRAMVRAARGAGLPLTPTVTLVPVPLHRSKLRRRGIHQALVLARRVGWATGTPVRELLVRRRDTPPQGDLDRAGRVRNVAGAFSSRQTLGGKPPRRAVLVDDVCTSGATARECARVLLQKGVERVDLLVACLAGSRYP